VAEARSAAVVEPGFATCAAYYFLAARGHGVQDYDRLYRAGEFSLNEATRRRGQQAATAKMEQASSRFMQQIHQDWRQIALLDRDYETPCARLLEAAGHVGK
jgi:glycine/D-amino acid oxidase-like deaminating enzyme